MGSRYVVVVVLVAVVVLALAFRFLARPVQPMGSSSTPVVPPPSVPIGVSVVVVGPLPFVESVTALFPDARPVSASSLPYLQNNSIVFIDWDYLLNNSNATLAVEHIRPLMDRHIFAIFTTENSSEALRLELLLADTWATANGAKPVAIPIVPNNRGLHYVVVAPMGHILMIAQTNKEGALQRLAAWLGAAEWSDDVCLVAAQQLENSSRSYYLYWFGPQSASDDYGVFTVDYCFEVNGNLAGTMNGVLWTPAWAYNYLGYAPSQTLINYGGYIVQMQTHQDAYSSYECYATNGNYYPLDAPSCGPPPYGYLTIAGYWWSYLGNLTVKVRSGGGVAAPPLGYPTYDITWTFTPNGRVAGQTASYLNASAVMPMAVPRGTSTPQSIILPVGSSAYIYDGETDFLKYTCETWGSDIYWLIFWPYPPRHYQVYEYNASLPSTATLYDGGAIWNTSWNSQLFSCT
ncbi:MAG: hypothetical protein QXP98_02480 [Thermoproteus sp.]